MTTINLDYQPDAAYYGDCADIMTAWKNQGVQGIIDLIYLDPPFNSNRNYGAPTSQAKASDTGSMDAFTDMWTYDSQAYERTERICKTTAHPASELIGGLRGYLEKRDDGMLAYLTYMADRLWLMHGLLKETGSIYLHCDPSANYYIRLVMDAIFGPQNFRNEIVWKRRADSHNLASKHLGKIHDVILWYAKSEKSKYRIQYLPYDDEYLKKSYKREDERGKYRLLPCTNETGGNRKYEFKGITRAWRFSKSKMEELYASGMLVQLKPGSVFNYKKYLTDAKGVKLQDLWDDIPPARGKEWLGYPTQKPLALLDRIIKASSNEGDIVLDPFCGCGTTIHLSINNKRRFIGMDISVFSIHSVTHKRIKSKCGIDIPVYGIPTNIAGARLLAKQDPFAFEAWAAETLNFGDIGILSNKIKRCDGGIDGKGKLYGKTDDSEDEIIVQVKSGHVSKDNVRAFAQIIQSNPKVAAGIFITLDDKDWSSGMEKWAQSLGTFTMPNGTRSFRRLQHWPISDRFQGEDGVYPKMPIMVNPLNGKPLVNIGTTIQSDLA